MRELLPSWGSGEVLHLLRLIGCVIVLMLPASGSYSQEADEGRHQLPAWAATIKQFIGLQLDYRLLHEASAFDYGSLDMDSDVSYTKHAFSLEVSVPLVDYRYSYGFDLESSTAQSREARYSVHELHGTGLFRLAAWLNDGELDWGKGRPEALWVATLGGTSYRRRTFDTAEYSFDGSEIYLLGALGYEAQEETFFREGRSTQMASSSRAGLMYSHLIHYTERAWLAMSALQDAWGVERKCSPSTWTYFSLTCDQSTLFSFFWLPGFDLYWVSRSVEGNDGTLDESGYGLGVAPSASLVYIHADEWYRMHVRAFASAWWSREFLDELNGNRSGWYVS